MLRGFGYFIVLPVARQSREEEGTAQNLPSHDSTAIANTGSESD